MGTISVFSMLNLAPDALHQRVRISCSVSYLSDSDRYIMVLSAYKLILMLVDMPGIVNPARLGEFHTAAASGLMAKLNSKQDKGSPCRTPLVTWYRLLRDLFIITEVVACWYIDFTVLMNMFGKLKVFSTSIRYLWSTLSYAFSWSRATIDPFSSM